MTTQLQVRHDTAANWTSANPTLLSGEIGFESDTGNFKIGNGSTVWTSLGYAPNGLTQSQANSIFSLNLLNQSTKAPINISGGTLLSSATQGAFEFDNFSFYGDVSASSRGVMPTDQFIIQNTAYTLTSQTAAQKLFNASTNGTLTLNNAGVYVFEGFFSLSSMSATSGSFGFAMGGTSTMTMQWWSLAQKGTATLATATATQSTYNATTANTAIATASTNTVGYAFVKGIINVTVAGTLIPQVSLGVAAAAVVGVGSYFKISPYTGNNGTGNFYVGNWS